MTKKIWILEGFIDADRMQENLQQNRELLETLKEKNDADGIKMAQVLVETWERRIKETPEGFWCGYQGKSDYRTFCRMAQETLRNPYMKDMKYRVLKADLRDAGAKYWPGNYENGIENPGVLRYLYATL